MALTAEQKAKLKIKLTLKLVEVAGASLTWDDLQLGIDNLSDDDKTKIVKAVAGGGESVINLINTRLRSYVEQSVTGEVNTILAQDFVPIELLYKVMQ